MIDNTLLPILFSSYIYTTLNCHDINFNSKLNVHHKVILIFVKINRILRNWLVSVKININIKWLYNNCRLVSHKTILIHSFIRTLDMVECHSLLDLWDFKNCLTVTNGNLKL